MSSVFKPPSRTLLVAVVVVLCPLLVESQRWRVSEWGPCSHTCGPNGQQRRTLSCQRHNRNLPGYLCPGDTPSSSRACNRINCPPEVNYLLGDCTKTCGGGQHYAIQRCKYMSAGGSLVDTSLDRCNITNTAADFYLEVCNTQACPTFRHKYGPWSGCSSSCGSSGFQLRNVTCIRNRYFALPEKAMNLKDCNHLGEAVTRRPCPRQKPCLTFKYKFGRWSACSATCGEGHQTRTVTCELFDGTNTSIVNTTQCQATLPDEKPSSSQTCNTGRPCPSYEFKVTAWQACSASCGGGEKVRSLRCLEKVGSTQTSVDIAICERELGASTQHLRETCATNQCPTYLFETTAWSACTQSCGSGKQRRVITCLRTEGGQTSSVELGECSKQLAQPVPSIERDCDSLPQCPVYRFGTGDWSACSVSCGTGRRTRPLTCIEHFNANQRNVELSFCQESTLVRPKITEDCRMPACVQYEYQLSAWSSCSAGCGIGRQTRRVGCAKRFENGTEQVVSAHTCARHLGRHERQHRRCSSTSACSWTVETVGPEPCSRGQPTYNRTARCIDNRSGATAPDRLCSTAVGLKPQDSEHSCRYVWSASNFGQCSVTCGGGTKRRRVSCKSFLEHHSHGEQREVPLALCSGLRKPKAEASCNHIPFCPGRRSSQGCVDLGSYCKVFVDWKEFSLSNYLCQEGDFQKQCPCSCMEVLQAWTRRQLS